MVWSSFLCAIVIIYPYFSGVNRSLILWLKANEVWVGYSPLVAGINK
jgi:hypothetical protein